MKQIKRCLGAISALFGMAVALSGPLPVYAQLGAGRVNILQAPGFTISWNQNNGNYFNPAWAPSPPQNDALASRGAVAIGSSELNLGVHFIHCINDGAYGNANSWISRTPSGSIDPDPWVGVLFPAPVEVRSVAWGRDNGNDAEGIFADRAVGTYTIQVTRVSHPSAATPDTGDASTGWRSVGAVQYLSGTDTLDFSAHLRHEFSVSEAGQPAMATALRIKVSDGQMDIDELEVNSPAPPESRVRITPAIESSITWDGSNGAFVDAAAPANSALAANGAIAIGSSELNLGVHFIRNVNDGVYGNASSWISRDGLGGSTDPNPWIGVALPSLTRVGQIAWGRDNRVAGFRDRSIGAYTLQFTRAANPSVTTPESGDASSGWQTLGTVEYLSGSDTAAFATHLRHQFEVRRNGQPVLASGFRIKVSDPTLDVDELEVYAMENRPPVLSIDAVQNACDDIDTVALSGSATDPDGDPIGNYQWTQIGGPAVELHDANTLHPYFKPPTVAPGQVSVTLSFEFTATELAGFWNVHPLSGAASVNVLVKHSNRAPVADAGPSQTAPEGSLVKLDGSASFDPDNDSIGTFAWTQTAGPMVELTGADTARPMFVAPDVGPEGATLRFDLMVTDQPNDEYCGTALPSIAQSVEVRVQYVNHGPTIAAGESVTANEGTHVNLAASAADEDGNPLTWTWTQLSGPTVVLDLLDPTKPSFVAPQVSCEGANLSFRAAVDDGFGGSAETILFANILNVNNAPVADAGTNQSVPEGAAVALHGEASSDPDGEAIGYTWSQVAGPAVALTDAHSAAPMFSAPLVTAGGDPNATVTLRFALTVVDSCGGTAEDFTEVKVSNVDHAPIASAGGSQTHCEADLVTLNGAASSDPDGDALSYSWTQVAGPAVALAGANTAAPQFQAPFTGPGGETLMFELAASDGFGGVSRDTATIALINCNTPPDASKARASETVLWPPNHALIPVSILGVQDPDNNATITITSVTQDEPVNGTGDGDTGPDAVIRGNVVLLRAERCGRGNGRVYHIHFTAADAEGSSSGIVTVNVPANKKTDAVIDGGELYNSTQ